MWFEIKQWYKNLSIKNKIITIFLPLSILPIFILGYFSSRVFTTTIIDRTLRSATDNGNMIITRINGMLQNVESCSNMLTININRVINPTVQTDGQKKSVKLHNEIRNQLSYALLVFTDVESAAFIDTNGMIYSTNYKLERNIDKAIKSDLMKKIGDTTGESIWFEMQKRNFLTTDEQEPVLSLGKKVIHIETGKTLGVLILNIKETAFSSIYKNLGSRKYTEYFIVDEYGRIISTKNKQQLLQPIDDSVLQSWMQQEKNQADILKSNGKEILMTTIPFEENGWHLIGQASLEDLTIDLKKTSILIIVVSILCVSMNLFGVKILSYLITNPIEKIKDRMSKISEGNFDVYFNIDSKDEIGMFARGFNLMAIKIKELLQRIEYEQKKKREYELALIQEQIKPHFLYNCLDVIYTLSEMGRWKDVQKTTKALADFYRISLSKGREIITIEEEIKHVQDYLSIQRIRYSDVFDYEVAVHEDILNDTILKLTIQPLVENAIYHGLKTKNTFGKILIQGFKEKDKIILKVIDDGVGISEEKLKEIFDENNLNGERKHFGLHSVADRLKLFYGDKGGLKINSRTAQGTEVIVYLPIQGEKMTYDKNYNC